MGHGPGLSPTQKEQVLGLIAQGLTKQQVADTLQVSIYHVKNAYREQGALERIARARLALRLATAEGINPRSKRLLAEIDLALAAHDWTGVERLTRALTHLDKVSANAAGQVKGEGGNGGPVVQVVIAEYAGHGGAKVIGGSSLSQAQTTLALGPGDPAALPGGPQGG